MEALTRENTRKSDLQAEKQLGSKVDSQDKKIYNSLNLLKILAIFLVIFYHFGWGFRDDFSINFFKYTINNWNLKYYYNTFVSICVPIFFMVNGALLLNSKYNHKKHIKKCIKLLIMITVFSFAILLVDIPLMHLSFIKFLKTIFAFAIGYNNHLWFLQQLFIIYLLYPFLKQVFDNYKKYFVAIIVLSLFFVIVVKMEKGWVFESYNFSIKQYAFSVIYFMIGGVLEELFRKRIFPTRIRIIITVSFVALIPLMMLVSYNYARYLNVSDVVWGGYELITTFVITTMVFVLFRINDTGKNYNFVNLVANQTMFVYIWQNSFIKYWHVYIKFVNFEPIVGFIPSLIILFVLAGFGWLATKNKWIKFCFKL